jgi:hypothetical protein
VIAAVLLHFLVGTAGALAVFLVLTRLSGATSFSAPFGVVFIGIACAALAHFMSPWATPAILLLYALAGVNEHVQDHKAPNAIRKSEERTDE